MSRQTVPLMTISELKEAKWVDHGVFEALRNYLLYGLNPGSFGIACLMGDYELAYSKAHSHLKRMSEPDNRQENIILNMVSLASFLPASVAGDYEVINRWCNQGGLANATQSQIVLLKLEWCPDIWGSFPTL